MEQGNLYRQIPNLNVPYKDSINEFVVGLKATGQYPGAMYLPYMRCPSDGFPNYINSNYAANIGFNIMDPSICSPPYDPFAPAYCDGSKFGLNYNACPAYPGQSGDPQRQGGLFYEGTTPGGPWFSIASCTDGLSNTFLLGEILIDKGPPEAWERARPDQRNKRQAPLNPGWADLDNGLSDVGVHVPLNYPIKSAEADPQSQDGVCDATNNTTSFYNWSVSTGFKSNHTGGANFAFADGSVHFISQSINYLTYIKLGIRNDGGVIGDY
jgi:prepilin-type processing-associated H-X9-DG protein